MTVKHVVSAFALALSLAACKGEDLTGSPVVVSPPPPPPQTGTSFNVERCLNQNFAGRRLIDHFLPDVVQLDLSQPASFPNGRRLQDPVIDIYLSGLFLDQTRHTPNTLANIPVNPSGFDQPVLGAFPYYARKLGTAPLSATNGANFAFRTDPVSAYVKVERVAFPAVSTINILGPRKNPYNDATPTRDAALEFRADIAAGLAQLTGQIADDLQGLGLTICATPI